MIIFKKNEMKKKKEKNSEREDELGLVADENLYWFFTSKFLN